MDNIQWIEPDVIQHAQVTTSALAHRWPASLAEDPGHGNVVQEQPIRGVQQYAKEQNTKKKKTTVTPWNSISLLSASFQGATLRAHFVIHFNAFNFKGWQVMHAHSLPATKFLREDCLLYTGKAASSVMIKKITKIFEVSQAWKIKL